jgi:hypothetical protein
MPSTTGSGGEGRCHGPGVSAARNVAAGSSTRVVAAVGDQAGIARAVSGKGTGGTRQPAVVEGAHRLCLAVRTSTSTEVASANTSSPRRIGCS